MRDNIEERAREIGMYIVEQKTTVRAAAARFGVSKSTVHTVVMKRSVLFITLRWPVKVLLLHERSVRTIISCVVLCKEHLDAIAYTANDYSGDNDSHENKRQRVL